MSLLSFCRLDRNSHAALYAMFKLRLIFPLNHYVWLIKPLRVTTASLSSPPQKYTNYTIQPQCIYTLNCIKEALETNTSSLLVNGAILSVDRHMGRSGVMEWYEEVPLYLLQVVFMFLHFTLKKNCVNNHETQSERWEVKDEEISWRRLPLWELFLRMVGKGGEREADWIPQSLKVKLIFSSCGRGHVESRC